MFQLRSTNYSKFASILDGVEFNCLFARSVVEGLAQGEVWVDSEIDPTLIHFIHSYGMTLLLVRSEQIDWGALEQHLSSCRARFEALWMQLHPISIAPRFDDLLAVDVASADSSPIPLRIRRHTRTNFVFVRDRYLQRASAQALPSQFRLRPMCASDFAHPGISVSPHRFWASAAQFLAHGGGWCISADEEVASMAFTSFRIAQQLEIGVETYPAFRTRGFARHAATALIDHCLSHDLEPVWSCRKTNTASFSLALALGFVPSFEGPYYYLPGAQP